MRWFEEPVSSDDLEGLAFVRQSAPPAMEIAAGEYGYDADYVRRMLASGAVERDAASRGGGLELKRRRPGRTEHATAAGPLTPPAP